MESKIDDLKKTKPDEEEKVLDEDAQVALLADLQQQQDDEAARLLENLDAKVIVTMMQTRAIKFGVRITFVILFQPRHTV